jgi:hypothetical protein
MRDIMLQPSYVAAAAQASKPPWAHEGKKQEQQSPFLQWTLTTVKASPKNVHQPGERQVGMQSVCLPIEKPSDQKIFWFNATALDVEV